MEIVRRAVSLYSIVGSHSVIADRKTEILPRCEQVEDLNILSSTDLIELTAEPASGKQRTSCEVASSSLLFYKEHCHPLCLCLLRHICNSFGIFGFIGIVLIVDTDRDYVIIALFTVCFDRCELTAVEESLSVLS